MDEVEVKHFIEAALLAAGRPLNLDQLQKLFDGRMTPEKSELRKAIAALNEEYEERGIVISEVASGFRMQVKTAMATRLHKLWEERPPRYSRALFETLALIAYRQPITRGEIEEIRGVAVSSNITRQLLEREWVRVVGHRDVPGRPSMFGTTKNFLDYFGLKRLDDLPPLAELADWESLRLQLNLPEVEGTDGSEAIADAVTEEADATADDSEVEASDDIEATNVHEQAVPEATEAEPAWDEVADELDDGASDKVIPVLFPEGEEPASDAVEELPEVEEELAVSEWPEPVG